MPTAAVRGRRRYRTGWPLPPNSSPLPGTSPVRRRATCRCARAAARCGAVPPPSGAQPSGRPADARAHPLRCRAHLDNRRRGCARAHRQFARRLAAARVHARVHRRRADLPPRPAVVRRHGPRCRPHRHRLHDGIRHRARPRGFPRRAPDDASIEALIGLSIALAAAENLWLAGGRRPAVRWTIAALLLVLAGSRARGHGSVRR